MSWVASVDLKTLIFPVGGVILGSELLANNMDDVQYQLAQRVVAQRAHYCSTVCGGEQWSCCCWTRIQGLASKFTRCFEELLDHFCQLAWSALNTDILLNPLKNTVATD